MKNVKTISLALLLMAATSLLQAQPAKDAPPAPPAAAPSAAPAAPAANGQPTTSVVVPSQANPREAATEVLENPYGIEALWKQGDFIARGTLIILIIMSIGSWYIGIVKYIEQARLMKDAREADAKFWSAKTVADGAATLREDSAFRFMAEEGSIAVKDHGGMATKQLDLASWLGMSLDRAIDVVSNRLQTGLAFLATVGSTAPFVGLSVRCGASITRSPPSALPDKPRSTRSPARSAKRSS